MNEEDNALNNSLTFLSIFFIAIVADLFFFAQSSDIRYALLILYWLFVVRALRFQSDATFKLTLGLLGALFLFFIFDRTSLVTEKIATWIYLFLWVGVIQQWLELKKLPKKSSS